MSTADHDTGSIDATELTPITPAENPSPNVIETDGLKIWAEGNAIGCACPQCKAPMAVRLWLLMADCAFCGCSIELTEEQEKEVMRLLEKQEQNDTQPPPQEALPDEPVEKVPVATPSQPPAEKKIPVAQPKVHQTAQQPTPAPVKQPVAKPHRQVATNHSIGVRKQMEEEEARGRAAVWVKNRFTEMPAWLVSMIFHMIALILLSMYAFGDKEKHEFTLVARSARIDPINSLDQETEMLDETEFDDPTEFPVEVMAEIAEITENLEETLDTESGPEMSLPDEQLVEYSLNEIISGQIKTGNVGLLSGRGVTARAQLVQAYGGTTASETAVAKGLKWLSRKQLSRGNWHFRQSDVSQKNDTAATGLALLPFLGAGITHKNGEQYSRNVYRGLKWLVDNQRKDGSLMGKNSNSGMYGHAICTMALCEAYAITKDPTLKEPARLATQFIVKPQRRTS